MTLEIEPNGEYAYYHGIPKKGDIKWMASFGWVPIYVMFVRADNVSHKTY